jgi:ubiquinone/menaquinone biosynthesis C-methylase UbiE
MGFYGDQILPRIMNVALGRPECARMRARVTAGLSGDVLEVGFGSGLNVPHYPPAVRRVLAVDPATVGRKLAERRVAASDVEVAYVGLDGASLPLDDDSVDHALTTWTLCTIPDVQRALTEIRRVLRPAGSLHFLEHGRAPDAEVSRWQDRITPVQRRVAGGCHPNRPIEDLLTQAGFEVTSIDRYYMSGPKSEGYMYEGVATKAS